MDALLKAPVDDSPFVQMAKPDAPAFRKELIALGDRQDSAGDREVSRLPARHVSAPRRARRLASAPIPAAPRCYQAAVKYHATVDLTPQQIHDIGLAEMEKIQAEMRTIGERGFKQADPDRSSSSWSRRIRGTGSRAATS